MAMLTQPTNGPRVALIYVTVGALIDVWTLVWYFTRDAALTTSQQFWIVGLALTGLTFVVLGLLLGRLGRSAREEELPPAEAVQAEANIAQTAAANPPAMAVPNGAPLAAPPPVAPTNGAIPPAQPAIVMPQAAVPTQVR